LLAILALSGCTDERGIHREPLRARFGETVTRISEQAERLARAIREGVGSVWFEVVDDNTVPLAPGELAPIRATGGIVRDSSTGQWKEKGRDPWRRMFDSSVMDNLYEGYGTNHSRVLCTTALGLAVAKRKKQEGGEIDGQQRQYLDFKGEGSGSNARLESTLLLKPKVLLESVKELL